MEKLRKEFAYWKIVAKEEMYACNMLNKKLKQELSKQREKQKMSITLNEVKWKIKLSKQSNNDGFGETKYTDKTITLFLKAIKESNELEQTVWHEVGHAHQMSLPQHYTEPTTGDKITYDWYADAFEEAYKLRNKINKLVKEIKREIKEMK